VERAYSRARELCELLGDPPELFHALLGLYFTHLVRGELQTADELAEQLLLRAQRAHDPTQLTYAHMARGETAYWRGEFVAAREHLEKGIAFYDPERHRQFTSRYSASDAGIACLLHVAWTLWQLGYPEQSLRRGNEALGLAQALCHSYSLAFSDLFVGVLRQYRREARAAEENAEAAIALSAKYGLSHTLAYATTLRGWAIYRQGLEEEGIEQIQEGLTASRAMWAELHRTHCLCLLAEACIETDRHDEGLRALDEALATVDERENRFYEAETHRLKGELLLKQDNSNVMEAQHCFQRAIEIARNQCAKSWELRATTSLARLLGKQGKLDEARTILAEIYNWFTEGFDTCDLKDATTLLEELGA
jgi:adenylate cyclase